MSFLTDRTALLLACSISAGTHAALAPHHLAESPVLGASFALAAGLLALAAILLGTPRVEIHAAAAAALLLVALIAGYAATRFAAIPPLTHAPEPIDAIGALTKFVEIAGLIFALRMYSNHREGPRSPRALPQKGVPS